MLQNIKPLYGSKLAATDGDIGHVRDFYFDDKTWLVRYLVVDTGDWLPGRRVLLPPHAFGTHPFAKADTDAHVLRVNLSRKKIEHSPSIDTHRPVSRQYEIEYYTYYGWPAYWTDYGIGVVAGIPAIPVPPTPETRPHHGHNQRDDLHLRSTKAMTGYQIHATDGAIGTVLSFMVDGEAWAIRELVVGTGHWYAGKTILLLPENITRISYEDSSVFVNLTREDLRQTGEKRIAHAGAAQV